MAQTLIDVMNCKSIKTVADLPAGEYIMEPKLDGFRLTATVTGDDVVFNTRAKKRQDGKLPHIHAELAQVFPPGTVLDGEICALTLEGDRYINDFEHVQSVMLSLPERSVQVQQDTERWLQYFVFDIIALGGEDLRDEPLSSRRKVLNTMLSAAETKFTKPVPTFDASDDIHDALVENGFEGSVVKSLDGPYLSGQRGKGWYKIKNQPTVDCVIVGYQDGNGKFEGLVGAVLFGQPLDHNEFSYEKRHPMKILIIDGSPHNFVVRGKASGMDDEERKYMSENREELMGTVIEVAHMGIFPNGVTMRHPQFRRFRPDKKVYDVQWHDN